MVQQPARYTVGDVIKIGMANVTMNDKAKGPMIFRKSANSVALESPPVEGAAANDNEASSSKMVPDPKYFQPRWCPPGLTHSQYRKLQRLRAKEKREREAERVFNEMHPIYPQSKRRARAAETQIEAATLMTPDVPAGAIGTSGMPEDPAGATRCSGDGSAAPITHGAGNAPIDAEISTSTGEAASIDEMLDYEDSPDRPAMDVNVIAFYDYQ